jgi:hypothetical protein
MTRVAGECLLELDGCKRLPENEGQCRELVKAKVGECRTIWENLVAAADGEKITAAVIKEAVDASKTTTVASHKRKTTNPSRIYVVSLRVDSPSKKLDKMFGTTAVDGVYVLKSSKPIQSGKVAKFLMTFGKWFTANADTLGLLEFTVSGEAAPIVDEEEVTISE